MPAGSKGLTRGCHRSKIDLTVYLMRVRDTVWGLNACLSHVQAMRLRLFMRSSKTAAAYRKNQCAVGVDYKIKLYVSTPVMHVLWQRNAHPASAFSTQLVA